MTDVRAVRSLAPIPAGRPSAAWSNVPDAKVSPIRRTVATSSTMSVEVVHLVRGRVRLRVPRLKSQPHLATRIVGFLGGQPGVTAVRVSAICASLVITFDEGQVTVSQVIAWLPRAETAVQVPSVRAILPHPSPRTVICGLAALGLGLLGAPALLSTALLVAATVPVVVRAVRTMLTERRLSVDLLDSFAIGSLIGVGDVLPAALCASLIAVGEHIRALTARRSRLALASLTSLEGRFVWVLHGARVERVPIAAVVVGDLVLIQPGETIPIDGVIEAGRALVDQKALTGEAAPALKAPGQPVYATTIVTDGHLRVRAEHVGAATRASRILRLLDEAPVQDTRLANYAGRFADRLVLPTLLLAGGIFAVTRSLPRAISVLIFDFATGIRVSAPTTVLAAMTAAAQSELLIKGGRAIETLARVDTIVFDKTGTLTTGSPQVIDIRVYGEADPDEVLGLAAAAELRLSHPAAKAIVQAALDRGIAIPEAAATHYVIGRGVEAQVAGAAVLVGGQRFLADRGVLIETRISREADGAAEKGATPIFVAYDSKILGVIFYADASRSEAREVIARLRSRGVDQVLIVTGDRAAVAQLVADELGIDRVEADVFPERKAEIVRQLQRRGRVVAVVGDGINDSPALAYADVSISLQAGVDVAREAADVVLHGDLHGIVAAIDLSRETLGLVQQNLAIVGVPNAIGLVLATAGLVGPVAATAVNNGSTVVAALNALRPLLRPRIRQASG